MTSHTLSQHRHLTFKANLRDSRYGWLRLTPAYSLHLVTEIIDSHPSASRVLDPFCGTGTTALACAERGVPCDTTDINPFLVWLTTVKTRAYTPQVIDRFREAALTVQQAISRDGASEWLPPIHQIDKWWDSATLHALGHAQAKIRSLADSLPAEAIDLLQVSFCRVMIDHSNASFGHQSMSFKKKSETPVLPFTFAYSEELAHSWNKASSAIATAAASLIARPPRAILCDARNLTSSLSRDSYDLVVTSPPYPNRMSYIRELRPYMYWLGFLSDSRAAGELDWLAIGGTWGCATSNLVKWQPASDLHVPFDQFNTILRQIASHSELLSAYVHKYFNDMMGHCSELFNVVKPGGSVHYIVGNSKFYDVLLPVEEIYAAMFQSVGFVNVQTEAIRKRNSKRELFEFIVRATKPV